MAFWEDHNFCVELREWLAVFNYLQFWRACCLPCYFHKRHTRIKLTNNRISISMSVRESCIRSYLIKICQQKSDLTFVTVIVCNKNLKINRISHLRWWFSNQGWIISKTDDVVGLQMAWSKQRNWLIWKSAEFRTPDGGSPTKDGLPKKKTDYVVELHSHDQNKEIGNKLCELTQNYHNFWTCREIFSSNNCWPFTWITDILFRYGHVRFDTNINPQVPIFGINREPVPAPTVWLDV